MKNVARFAIREIDEDNYDESLEQHLIIEPLHVLIHLLRIMTYKRVESSSITKIQTRSITVKKDLKEN